MSGGTVTIKNWARYQHYKHRSPPWIRLYGDLLDPKACPWYRGLSDNAARFLVELWLAARRDGGVIPYDSLMILRECGRPSAHKPLLDSAISELASAGAIKVAGADASAEMLAEALAPPRPQRGERRVQSTEGQSSVASQPGQYAPDDMTDGQLMGLVRLHLYVPDGRAPKGYRDGRDVTIIRALRRAGLSGLQIADAIEGVRLLCDRGELGRKRPREKLTMRALYHTGHGVRPLLYQAQEALHRAAAARPPAPRVAPPAAPAHIGDVVRDLLRDGGGP